jgi:hypothetical protein
MWQINPLHSFDGNTNVPTDSSGQNILCEHKDYAALQADPQAKIGTQYFDRLEQQLDCGNIEKETWDNACKTAFGDTKTKPSTYSNILRPDAIEAFLCVLWSKQIQLLAIKHHVSGNGYPIYSAVYVERQPA